MTKHCTKFAAHGASAFATPNALGIGKAWGWSSPVCVSYVNVDASRIAAGRSKPGLSHNIVNSVVKYYPIMTAHAGDSPGTVSTGCAHKEPFLGSGHQGSTRRRGSGIQHLTGQVDSICSNPGWCYAEG